MDENETTEEPKTLSNADAKKLFEKFAKADKVCGSAEITFTNAKKARSAAANDILEQLGGGPFRVKGEMIRVRKCRGGGVAVSKAPTEAVLTID